METLPTSPALSGKNFSGTRTLAAIVFTDTVSFSALAAKNEEHTLKLVDRDLERMKKQCESFGGQTVKCTGDGLLLFFNSAVQAVSCALAIQKNIGDSGRYLRPQDRLVHRVGVHLGDVFVNGEDVMGDGVNIAARLQSAAQPGGVCISGTIFHVVNNRVKFQVVLVEEKNLKNVGKVVTYHILPPGVRLEQNIAQPDPSAAFTWPRKVLVGGVTLALLSLGLIAYSVGKSYAATRSVPLTAPSNSATNTPTPAPVIDTQPVVDTPPVVPPVTDTATTAASTTTPAPSDTKPTVTDQTYTPTDTSSTVPGYSTPTPPTSNYTPSDPTTTPSTPSYPGSGTRNYTPPLQQVRQMIRNREEERRRR